MFGDTHLFACMDSLPFLDVAYFAGMGCVCPGFNGCAYLFQLRRETGRALA